MEVEIKYKQYVIVPEKPKMSKGKIASQVAHATYLALKKQNDKKLEEQWRKSGMCVIVLKTKDLVHLLGIAKYLENWYIPFHLYVDEGLTEVEMGTPTALATGILTEDEFWIFRRLKRL